ncbi:unnamed protein product [Ambrosiozyma monospora]|uniref:Unnamed protein product n=1 Tax=Ambrosiozyma monospora TaxID=43982 RepID=A0A9W6T3Y8_AMBMO|nr:unnamed protein product [Ambrosiozyma monospora]
MHQQHPQPTQLFAFFKLGSNLVSHDGKIHNGIITTLLDENLCFCGFPNLPSKRGVTARLTVNYLQKAPPNSNVVLVAQVKSAKGRKVVVEGYVETLGDHDDGHDGQGKGKGNSKGGVRIADAVCILVEPTWFKYLSWVPLFN